MTKAEATKIAKDALKTMPASWKTYVWENIGWHVSLMYGDGRVSVFYSEYSKDWHCMIHESSPRSGNPSWHSNRSFKQPYAAVAHEINKMDQYVGKLMTFRNWASGWNTKERKNGSC